MFENDPEGFAMAQRYAGKDFDKPRIVEHEVFNAWDGEEWTPDDFLKAITAAIAQIPDACRPSANVAMENAGYDSGYRGPESAETVAARIANCERYVDEQRRRERSVYEALKQKFEK